MTLISRNISFDNVLKKYTLDIEVDGENETLVFDTSDLAYSEHASLLRQGAHHMPLELDRSL